MVTILTLRQNKEKKGKERTNIKRDLEFKNKDS